MKIATTLIAVVVLFSPAPALSQEHISIAWAGATPTNSPIWVVEERQLLKKHATRADSASGAAGGRFGRYGHFGYDSRALSLRGCRYDHDLGYVA